MKKFQYPAIVLSGGGTTGLGAVRSLGRAGVVVYFLDDKNSEAIYSRFCTKYFIYPKIGNSEELRKILTKLRLQLGKKAVLFPASDSCALNLSNLRDELTGYCLPAPRKEVLEIVIQKRRFYDSLSKERIPHPTTYFFEDPEDARELTRNASYPVFIKPSVSHAFRQRFQERKGYVAKSDKDVLRFLALMEKAGVEVMIQEIVPGPPTNHVFLDGYINGRFELEALFARRRLRMWPPFWGNSSLCMSIPLLEIVPAKESLLKYLKAIGYQGIFSAEFKADERNGVFKLLEINARTSAWFNTLSAKCGVNLMLFAYLDAIGEDVKYPDEYECGVKWIYLRDDLRASTRMLFNGDLSAKEWILSYLGKKDFMSLATDDPRPFLKSLSHTIAEII